MAPSFLTPPLERLSAAGFAPASPGAPWRRPQVLLARELCSFELFEPPAAGAAARAAAELYARTAAPYAEAGHLVRRQGGRFGVWWWDLEAVEPKLVERFGDAQVRVVPEPLAEPAGEGWRIVRRPGGYEAQLWVDGGLTGSLWRRAPFDPAAWAAFVRAQPAYAPAPPTAPPPAQPLPYAAAGLFGPAGWSPAELTPADSARLAAGAAILLMVVATSFSLAQGLRLRALSEQAERQAREIRAATPRALTGEDAASRRLAAFSALTNRPNAMAALARALEMVRRNGVQPVGFDVEGPTLILDLPYADIGRIDQIALQLERDGGFANVRPIPDAQAKAIQLQMTVRPPLDGRLSPAG